MTTTTNHPRTDLDGSCGRRHRPQPGWTRRGERAIPKIDVPRLRSLDTDVMDDLRPIAIVLVARPLLALAAFLLMVNLGWWAATPLVVWALYGSTLSAVHHLLHGSVGLSARWRHIWLSVLGCLVAESGHALLATHTVHHRDGSDAPDPEGYIEYLPWRRMPAGAAKYRYRLMWWGLHNGTHRRRIRAELLVHAALHLASLALLPFDATLWIYLTMVHVASFAFAVLQGKGPQANWGRDMPTPLLLIHTRLFALLFFNHHQHLEHHAYPKVPLARLPRLRHVVEAAVRDDDVVHVRLPA